MLQLTSLKQQFIGVHFLTMNQYDDNNFQTALQ